jgi:CxxC-x17-CxxC domain-containing protein
VNLSVIQAIGCSSQSSSSWNFRSICFREAGTMEFADRILKCIDCQKDFVFTAGEQLFFNEKGFTNDPKRCKPCKAKRAAGNSRVRPETRTVCSVCGTETSVPFRPTQGRPVLCRSCFQKDKTEPGRSDGHPVGNVPPDHHSPDHHASDHHSSDGRATGNDGTDGNAGDGHIPMSPDHGSGESA